MCGEVYSDSLRVAYLWWARVPCQGSLAVAGAALHQHPHAQVLLVVREDCPSQRHDQPQPKFEQD